MVGYHQKMLRLCAPLLSVLECPNVIQVLHEQYIGMINVTKIISGYKINVDILLLRVLRLLPWPFDVLLYYLPALLSMPRIVIFRLSGDAINTLLQ